MPMQNLLESIKPGTDHKKKNKIQHSWRWRKVLSLNFTLSYGIWRSSSTTECAPMFFRSRCSCLRGFLLPDSPPSWTHRLVNLSKICEIYSHLSKIMIYNIKDTLEKKWWHHDSWHMVTSHRTPADSHQAGCAPNTVTRL